MLFELQEDRLGPKLPMMGNKVDSPTDRLDRPCSGEGHRVRLFEYIV